MEKRKRKYILTRDNSSKDRLNYIPQSLPGSLRQEGKTFLEFHFQCSSHWFVPTPAQNIHTQDTTHNTPAIKWLSKETGHYLSHVLRFGAHVFFQHKKLIPYPATLNSLEMQAPPWQVDNILSWLCG